MTEIFPLVPASSRALWFIIALMLFMVGLTLLFAWMAYGTMASRVEVAEAGLRIHSPMYGRLVPADAIRGTEARVVNQQRDPSLRLSWRTNGISMPGYGAGWFRLEGGRRALVFMTARDRVVHIPTRAGYEIMVSVRDPDGLVTALRRFPGDAPVVHEE